MKNSAMACAWLLCLTAAAHAQDDAFKSLVRPTDPLAPAEELKQLKVPEGFRVQLFAAEPDILKPLNMAFDTRGRLWISETVEYPHPVPVDQPGRDSIKILEDTDGDGRADKFTVFVDGLNIPMGLLPYGDGVIAFSIPNIWYFRDTDGDGKCDQRQKLYGPFGYQRDTHGLNNAFRRGFDGWIYACHGFNNQTTVRGADGHEVSMQSGNTYRFRPDGSRIEQFTWGQVNPFGMTFDRFGDLFTADCHSKPLYQLLRGGYYPSFGKPHDGLGFVTPMMQHTHGSTAIAGVVFYDDDRFPQQYRTSFFSGNVMTSRINRNSIVRHGSTAIAKEADDFLISADPWFRPVDLQIGPQGALYVADFYNRIIGHYEVPLDHPGRDRRRGRIWRISHANIDQATPRKTVADDPVAALKTGSTARRLRALNHLVDYADDATLETLLRPSRLGQLDPNFQSFGMWALHRRQQLPFDLLRGGPNPNDYHVAIQSAAILAEIPRWSKAHRQLALQRLASPAGNNQRRAADGIARHPHPSHLLPLLDKLEQMRNSKDEHLKYSLRLALRNQLRHESIFRALDQLPLTKRQVQFVAEVCLGIKSPDASAFLVRHLHELDLSREQQQRYLEHAARFAPPEQIPQLTRLVREQIADPIQQLQLLDSMVRGLRQRGGDPGPAVRAWANQLAGPILRSGAEPPGDDQNASAWTNEPLPDKFSHDNPWVVEQRISADGLVGRPMLSSLPRGERLTGRLHSTEFTIPAKLSFYLAGHIGPPNRGVTALNVVRLRHADTGEVLAEVNPPRNDTAQKIEWDLGAHAGKRGVLEVVDGDDRGAYAWLALGRFEPAVVKVPTVSPRDAAERQRLAAEIARHLRLEDQTESLVALVNREPNDPRVSQAAAAALVAMKPNPQLEAVVPLIGNPLLPDSVRRQLRRQVVTPNSTGLSQLLADTIPSVPAAVQVALAQSLAGNPESAKMLLELTQAGKASPRLLQQASVRQRLVAALGSQVEKQIQELTANLPPTSETAQLRIEQQRKAFARSNPDQHQGATVFAKHCAACHQLDGKGPLIGPQLDGIGARGPARLLEDLLDPNRNVDVAFRTTTLVLNDGKVRAGLLRREEGQQLILVDNQGKEFSVAQGNIEQRLESRVSLMPENLADRMKDRELLDLIGFLLTKTTKSEKAPGQ